MPSLKTLYTLEEAALMISPNGKITARSLRTEITNGRLAVTRVAGKIFVTEDQLSEFLDRCGEEAQAAGASSSRHRRSADPSIANSESLALATAQKLKKMRKADQ